MQKSDLSGQYSSGGQNTLVQDSLVDSLQENAASFADFTTELHEKTKKDRLKEYRSPSRLINLANYSQILTLLQVAADALTIIASFLAAYTLWGWMGPKVAMDVFEPESMSRYGFILGVTLVTFLIGFKVNGLYHPQRSLLNVKEFELILKTWMIGCGLVLAVLFLAHEFYLSRGIFLLTFGMLLFAFFLERYAFFRFNSFIMSCGFIETSALIYGAGEVGQRLLEKMRRSPKLGYHVAGFIDDKAALNGSKIQGVPVLGDFFKLREILAKTEAKRLFIALPQVPSKVVIDILNVCREAKCEFQIVPSLYDIVIQRVKVSEVEGIPLIGVQEPKYSFRTMIVKRSFDLLASGSLLLALGPLYLLIALGVKLTSVGPVLFKQKRVGRNSKQFWFYKFRSMYTDAPVYAQTPKSSHDPRITPLGRFLRRSSLDELPQLWNVLKGDMSLVGPRPEMPFIVEKYNELQRQRLNVKPGITGLWQISSDRALAIHENMDYDIYYINNQSLLLDMVILLKTVTSCLRGVGAC